LVFDPRNSIRPKKDWAEAVRTSLEDNNFTLQDISIQEAQQGDVLIVSIMGGVANHAITYIDKETVLNQSEFSAFEPLADWKDNVAAIYRHKELC
jgi:cell wall-associated NlpC family hydrolase